MYVFNINTQVARESGVTQDDIYNAFAAASYIVHITCFLIQLFTIYIYTK